MTSSVSDPAFRSISGCATHTHTHILFRIINALKDFESPLVFVRGADLSRSMMYVAVHGPDQWRTGTSYAEAAIGHGPHNAQDRMITGDQRRGEGTEDSPRPRAGSVVTCRFRLRSRGARSLPRGISSHFWRLQGRLSLTRPAIMATLTCLMTSGMIWRTGRKTPRSSIVPGIATPVTPKRGIRQIATPTRPLGQLG